MNQLTQHIIYRNQLIDTGTTFVPTVITFFAANRAKNYTALGNINALTFSIGGRM